MEFVMITILVLIGSGLTVFFYMRRQADNWNLEEVTFAYNDFPQSFEKIRLFFISDIHKRTVPEEMIMAVKEKADLVLIGGDLIEKGVPYERVRENIRRLKQIAPVYFVWGNNDYEVDYHRLDALLLEEGVTILANTAVTFESITGDKVVLLGVDSPTNKRDQLNLALKDSDTGFKILMSHDPSIMKKLHKEDNVRLTLAGHTHGGQIRLGPLGPYEPGGIKETETTTLLVSNGFGTTLLPLRLGAPAQVHLITIRSSNSTKNTV